VFASGYGLLVKSSVEEDLRLWIKRVGDLHPEEWDGATDLNEGAHHRQAVTKSTRVAVNNLLHLDPVRDVALVINAASQISCPCKDPTAAGDQYEAKLVA